MSRNYWQQAQSKKYIPNLKWLNLIHSRTFLPDKKGKQKTQLHLSTYSSLFNGLIRNGHYTLEMFLRHVAISRLNKWQDCVLLKKNYRCSWSTSHHNKECIYSKKILLNSKMISSFPRAEKKRSDQLIFAHIKGRDSYTGLNEQERHRVEHEVY